MLIELAHYTVLFALTVVGLQTLLLCPTLLSGGSAVAIKLGFRGACFSIALLTATFLILLSGFSAHDFSLAVVFESFDTRHGALYALQAFCSSREGFFFTFITVMALTFLAAFSKKDLATYQERGRYLFAGGFLIFAFLVLMLTTSNPFARIEEPPFEGVGFNLEWKPPYRILSVLFSFGACACLTFSFIKTICICSKGRQFVLPALKSSLTALLLLTCHIGVELMTGFTRTDNGGLWQWTMGNSLMICVFLLTLGQTVLLFVCRYARLFVNWFLFFSLTGVCFANAAFFVSEYRLFSLSATEVYFPNPITALCAVVGLICFLLFLCSLTLKKPPSEDDLFLYCRESFLGLSVSCLLAAGMGIGFLSFLPAVFIFLPNLPLRALPDLFLTTLSGTAFLASVFFFIAFKRRPFINGWEGFNKKNTLFYWGGVSFFACLFGLNVSHGGRIVFHCLPAFLILGSLLSKKTFILPRHYRECWLFLKSVPFFKYGCFFCATGFLIFSIALSHTALNRTETTQSVKIQELTQKEFPCSVELLSGKSETFNRRYRLLCRPEIRILKGEADFQWQEKPLNVKLLHTKLFSTRFIRINQTQEEDIRLSTTEYPALRFIETGIFLICAGLVSFLLSLKKEKTI